MRALSLLVLAVALVALPSCGKKSKEQQRIECLDGCASQKLRCTQDCGFGDENCVHKCVFTGHEACQKACNGG